MLVDPATAFVHEFGDLLGRHNTPFGLAFKVSLHPKNPVSVHNEERTKIIFGAGTVVAYQILAGLNFNKLPLEDGVVERNQGDFGNISVDEIRELLSEYQDVVNEYAKKVEYFSLKKVFFKYIESDDGEFFDYLRNLKETKKKKQHIIYTESKALEISQSSKNNEYVVYDENDEKYLEFIDERNRKLVMDRDVPILINYRSLIHTLDFEEIDSDEKVESVQYLTHKLKESGVLKNDFDLMISIKVECARACIDFINTSLHDSEFDSEAVDAFFRLGRIVGILEILSNLNNEDMLVKLLKILASKAHDDRYEAKRKNYTKAINMAIDLWKSGDRRDFKKMAKHVCFEINENYQKDYSRKNNGKPLPKDKLITYKKVYDALKPIEHWYKEK